MRVHLPIAFMIPQLDHVVVDVRDRMEDAARVFRSLGFQLTERSRHTLGSMNHLAVFESDYIELLGFDDQAATPRSDIAAFPVGLNGLVFSTDKPDELFRELRENGLSAQEPSSFSRPVRLPGGTADAAFRVVRLPGSVSFGRVYFCQHLTPELVWRPEWRQHPNGVSSIARILIAVNDPAASVQPLSKMFGPQALRAGLNENWTLAAGSAAIELISHAELAGRLGDAMPDPAGRQDYMAALSLRTSSISQAAQIIAASGVPNVRTDRSILIPASQAMNCALEFVEQ